MLYLLIGFIWRIRFNTYARLVNFISLFIIYSAFIFECSSSQLQFIFLTCPSFQIPTVIYHDMTILPSLIFFFILAKLWKYHNFFSNFSPLRIPLCILASNILGNFWHKWRKNVPSLSSVLINCFSSSNFMWRGGRSIFSECTSFSCRTLHLPIVNSSY